MHKKKINIEKIVQNKQANYKHSITKKLEVGILLLGWEVKSIRSKKIIINNGYILKKNNEAYLYNVIITPLLTSSSHMKYNELRIRKLLLKKNELNSLSYIKKINIIIPLEVYWKNNWIKFTIGLAKSKKQYDKRIEIKKREWMLDKKYILN